ncbi:hypothetical protein DXG03_003207 [Asterophora parasitica]|uniref:Asparaginase n=1 Tax=Asterophora parasitica TaxID=117018 RepID=A0A9P7KDZ9_9AGAR|nr:hypothetical protein DXG03_003207 [Asterophora parasitica]
MAPHDGYVVVHGGAGMHGHAREKEVKQALRLACKEALKGLHDPSPDHGDSSKCTPLNMVGNAIVVLEDDPHLNAGYGSNLSLIGTVECDAAIMDGASGYFGSVGAVSGIKNPIQLARVVLEYSRIPDPLGRIPPLYEYFSL